MNGLVMEAYGLRMLMVFQQKLADAGCTMPDTVIRPDCNFKGFGGLALPQFPENIITGIWIISRAACSARIPWILTA